MKSIECKDESNLFDTKENMKENTNVDLTEVNNHHNEIIKSINIVINKTLINPILTTLKLSISLIELMESDLNPF